MKILFTDCDILLYEDNGIKILKNGCLGVNGDLISYIGISRPDEQYDEVKNMSGKVLMPGLYNCHTHSPMVLLRGVGSDLPLDKWLFGKVCPIEDRLIPEDISAGSYLAMLEMISGGTVSFSDMYFEPEQTVKAVAEAGIRANITRPVQSFDINEYPEDSYRIKQSIELYDNFNGYMDSRILIDFCIHAEYTCNERITAYYCGLCNEKHGNLHIHLSETQKEHEECIAKYGKTPAEWFNSLGAFDSRAFAAHCVALSESDAELMKEKSVSIVHNPTSNMKLGSGFAPVQKYLDLGINVALGTDGAASNNNLNMFEEMHLASVIHNGYLRDATVMKASEILKMATINGAKLQGRDNCGELKTGYKADIIAVDFSAPHMRPVIDTVSSLVYSAQDSDVYMTMCDGKILYENGEYKTLDRERILYDVEKTVARLEIERN